MIRVLLIGWTCLQFGSTAQLNFGSPVAETVYGTVRGQFKTSRNGRSFRSFTAIPYARPPIGELRFAEPKKPDSWNNTRDATCAPPVCIQRNYLFYNNPPIEGTEDCLYLNVFIPQVSYSDVLLPVMVFIHWGAFVAGRSTTEYLGPEYFMDEDIILVTFNYRLGPFGFLSTTDDEAPGNYGLKDQVAALKWVQANIRNFGGDKNKVTIFGQSAGAGSVHYHLLSPASKDLFHRAISQSGSALAPWASPLNVIQKQITIMQGKLVGCENYTADSKDLVRCLRAVPAEEILDSQDKFKVFNGDPLIIFSAVVETESERNPSPFLTKTPLEYILKGEITKVPWMAGVVKNEGVLRVGRLLRQKDTRTDLNMDFDKLLTDVLLIFALSTKDPQGLYKNVTQFYLNGNEYIDIEDPRSVQGFIDIYSDRAFIYPLYQSILLHSLKQHAPIYLYNMDYETDHSYADVFAETKENINFNWGTCHCDDLLYLFNSPGLFPDKGLWRCNDIYLSRILISLWTNFAKYGNPNPPSIHGHLSWKPLNLNLTNQHAVNSRIQKLNIGGNCRQGHLLEITSGFYEERMKFWTDSDIFENVNGLR